MNQERRSKEERTSGAERVTGCVRVCERSRRRILGEKFCFSSSSKLCSIDPFFPVFPFKHIPDSTQRREDDDILASRPSQTPGCTLSLYLLCDYFSLARFFLLLLYLQTVYCLPHLPLTQIKERERETEQKEAKLRLGSPAPPPPASPVLPHHVFFL